MAIRERPGLPPPLGEVEALDARRRDPEARPLAVVADRDRPPVHGDTLDARVGRELLDRDDEARVVAQVARRRPVARDAEADLAARAGERRRLAVGPAVRRARADDRAPLRREERRDLLRAHADTLARHQQCSPTSRTASGTIRMRTRFPSASRSRTRCVTSALTPGGRAARASGPPATATGAGPTTARRRSTTPRKRGSSSSVTTTQATRGSAVRFRTLALLR